MRTLKTIMKSAIIVLLFFSSVQIVYGQNVAISDDNGYTADPSAMLDVKSTDKGFLMPRLTTIQRNAVINPATGLMVFDTDEGVFYFYNGTSWQNVSSGGASGVWDTDGTNVYLADPSNKVGVGTSTPQNKLVVKRDASSGIDEAIFAVVNEDDDTLFAVYPEGTRIYVKDDPTKAVGSKSGFAVGGFSLTKGLTNEYLRVTPDSVRVYIKDSVPDKAVASKGGFAIGGFSLTKGNDSLYHFFVNRLGAEVPFLTEYERDNIGIPDEGSIIFNTSDSCLQVYLGIWENIWCTSLNCEHPAITVQPANDTICPNEDAIIIITASGTNRNYTWRESTDDGYTWRVLSNASGTPTYSGAYNDTLLLTVVPSGYDGYKYYVQVSNGCGFVNSNVASLNFHTPPEITTDPVTYDVCFDDTASFVVISDGTGLSYQWQENTGSGWANISNGGTNPEYSGANADTLTLAVVPLGYNLYNYRCIVNGVCAIPDTSTAANLTVTTASPAPTAGTHTPYMNKITWNWNTVPGALGYKRNNVNDYATATDNGASTTYTQYSLTCETAYTLYVWAYDGCGNSTVLTLNQTSDDCYECPVSSVTDIDGNSYSTVAIGYQCWMQENLKVTKYASGTSIPLVTDNTAWGNLLDNNTDDAYCYYNNSGTNGNTYGALYTWAAAMGDNAVSSNSNPSGVQGVCPNGWHLPSEDEWDELIYWTGGPAFGGGKLKEAGTTHWLSPNTSATNSYGFTALPGGIRNSSGIFWYLGETGTFWTSTQLNSTISYRATMEYDSYSVILGGGGSKSYGYSVRCVKN